MNELGMLQEVKGVEECHNFGAHLLLFCDLTSLSYKHENKSPYTIL